MTIVLASKPGITGASNLAIPKEWDSKWFRGFIANQLKGADVRNAVGSGGISVTGTLASPYATIGFAAPITLPGPVTITAANSGFTLSLTASSVSTSALELNSKPAGFAAIEFDTASVATGFIGTTGAANQITAGAAAGDLVLRTQGGSVLISQDSGVTGVKLYQKGAFTGTLTGMTAVITGTVTYVIEGSTCTLTAQITGTSNATTLTMTGLPSQCQPASQRQFVPCNIEDNSANAPGVADVQVASGTINFSRLLQATAVYSSVGFTAAGGKGLNVWSITYSLL